jgi:hypothetical protein
MSMHARQSILSWVKLWDVPYLLYLGCGASYKDFTTVGYYMPTSYRPYSLDQGLLPPILLSAWLPEDHLAYFICDAVEAMGLEAFYARPDS